MKKILRKIFIAILSTLIVLNANLISFGATTAGQEMRTQVLYLADIIKNDNNMNEFVTRGDFARMIVKASTYKDTTNLTEGASAFSDVEISDENSSFIKVATREGYIASYLGGLFKPNEFVMYRDLIRACIALLGYENSDFTGNQVNGRYELFCSLRMNENIDKTINEYVTKKDCVNAIYNTLKTNKKNSSLAYGPSVFTKMSVNSDGELNATGLIKTKLEGPFILKSGEAINHAVPFDLTAANIFINGKSSSIEEIARELSSMGYLLYYYNTTTKTLYVYKEGTTLESSTIVKKGYVNHIYYSASDTITPTRVEIDLAYYNLGSSEVKFAFSYTGTIRVGDQIIFIYTKSDTSSDNEDATVGNVVTEGTITNAYIYNLRY